MRKQAMVSHPDAETSCDPPQQHGDQKGFQLKTNSAATAPAWKTIMKKVVTQITGCLNVRSRLKNPGFRINMSPIVYEPRSVFAGVRRNEIRNQGKPQFTDLMMAAGPSCRLVNIAQSRKIPEDGSSAGRVRGAFTVPSSSKCSKASR